MCLIFLSDITFRLARGASARGNPKEGEERLRFAPSPSPPLGFPLALPFPHSSLPLFRIRRREPPFRISLFPPAFRQQSKTVFRSSPAEQHKKQDAPPLDRQGTLFSFFNGSGEGAKREIVSSPTPSFNICRQQHLPSSHHQIRRCAE